MVSRKGEKERRAFTIALRKKLKWHLKEKFRIWNVGMNDEQFNKMWKRVQEEFMRTYSEGYTSGHVRGFFKGCSMAKASMKKQ